MLLLWEEIKSMLNKFGYNQTQTNSTWRVCCVRLITGYRHIFFVGWPASQ